MNTSRVIVRAAAHRAWTPPRPWPRPRSMRCISSSSSRRVDDGPTVKEPERFPPNAEGYRQFQKSRSNNPQVTDTTSTSHHNMPSLGSDKPPPDLISSVDPSDVPKDRALEDTDPVTAGTQPGEPSTASPSEFGVGEMEGITFKVVPLRRTGEDTATMRARLLCRSALEVIKAIDASRHYVDPG